MKPWLTEGGPTSSLGKNSSLLYRGPESQSLLPDIRSGKMDEVSSTSSDLCEARWYWIRKGTAPYNQLLSRFSMGEDRMNELVSEHILGKEGAGTMLPWLSWRVKGNSRPKWKEGVVMKPFPSSRLGSFLAEVIEKLFFFGNWHRFRKKRLHLSNTGNLPGNTTWHKRWPFF